MKMMPPDVISHENQLQHLSEPSIFMLDVFRTADHAGQIFIPHRQIREDFRKSMSMMAVSRDSLKLIVGLQRTCGIRTERQIIYAPMQK